MQNILQSVLQSIEVGKGQFLILCLPLMATLAVVGGMYDFAIYHGPNDPQSMDTAQLARQIIRGEGYTTRFLRPYAVAQLQSFASSQTLPTGGHEELFPAKNFPKGKPRIIPDTYNAPGYPGLLAAWFFITQPNFDESTADITGHRMYAPDMMIPILNQIFLLLTAVLVFVLGLRLFDQRVAWLSVVAYFGTNLIWQYSITALSTTVLMFLVTSLLFCALEIFAVGEACFETTDASFGTAWLWGIVLGLLLAAACLTRLHLLVLLVPILVFLNLMPRAHPVLGVLVAVIVIGAVAPWFWHVYSVSGNIMGSNTPQLIYGEGDYQGDEIFCATSIPTYESLFRSLGTKECVGLGWHLEHAWDLFGSNLIIIFFAAATLHQFKRRRTQMFQWLIIGSIFSAMIVNNLGVDMPDAMSPWNIVVLFFPCMIVIGSAFFFIMLDRLSIQLAILRNLIVIIALVLVAAPLGLTLFNSTKSRQLYNYPPYAPPLIRVLGQFSDQDEWVTTDMPWATAWYADRPSLWLPESINDFEDFYDNLCPTGILILTPITWSKPLNSLTDGEKKDWLSFYSGGPIPNLFPLTKHASVPKPGPAYAFWSDRTRWVK